MDTIRSKNMKNNIKSAAVFIAVLLGSVAEAGEDSFVIKCPHAHISSVLGLSDSVLSDTNRFPIAANSWYDELRLLEPLCGFDRASISLDEIDRSSREKTDRPHRLRSVNFSRTMPSGTTESSLVAEAQKLVDAVCALLDIESFSVKLRSDESLSRTCRHDQNETNIGFDLAKGQQIDVRIVEAVYVLREGRSVMLKPASLVLNVTYNRDLASHNHCMDMYVRDVPLKVHDHCQSPQEKAELEIDFGKDCADTLSARMSNSRSGGHLRAKRRSK